MNLLPFILYSLFITIVCGAIGTYYFIQFQKVANRMVGEKHKREKQNIVTTEDILDRFDRIVQYKTSNDSNELKLAIIDGDVLIEELLRLQNLQGDTMASLLAEGSMRGLVGMDKFWQFHRLRNLLVHDSLYALDVATGQKALKMLEDALHEWKLV